MAPTGLKFTVGSTWRMDLDTFRKDRQKPTDSNISGEKDHPNFCDQQKRSLANGFYGKSKESLQDGGQGWADVQKKNFWGQG